MKNDGTGAATVYTDENEGRTMVAEKNTLVKYAEPYMLAMSANDKGETGCQFFITLDTMPALNGTSHTIIGRLFKGKETIKYIEGLQEYRGSLDFIKKRIRTMPAAMGTQMNESIEDENDEKQSAIIAQAEGRIVIKDSGVYKFSRTDT